MSKIIITRGLRGFKLEVENSTLGRHIENHCESLIQPMIERQRGQVTTVPGNKFYLADEEGHTFYFINARYDTIYSIITTYMNNAINLVFELVEKAATLVDGTSIDIDNHTLNLTEPAGTKFEFQNPIVDHIVRPGHNHTVLEIQTGKGKALINSTPVETPYGWTPIGKLNVGDTVISAGGTHTQVIGVHPQGVVPLFKITFEDGRNVECCGEHLWEVIDYKTGATVTIDTHAVKHEIEVNRKRLSVPLRSPKQCPNSVLPVDPYILGDLLSSWTTDTYCPFYDFSAAPFIPDVYMDSSTEQKTELLQGFIDNHGAFRAIDAHIVIRMNNKELIKSIRELFRSLGGVAHLDTRLGMWQLVIRVARPSRFFKYSKFKKQAEEYDKFAITRGLGIRTIVPTRSKAATCITVDTPSKLFVIKSHIVTHNTAMAMKSIVRIGKRTLIITKPGYLDKWTSDVTGERYSLSLKPGELIRVGAAKGKSKMEELDGLIEMGKDGELDKGRGGRQCKVILMSSKTLDMWIKRCMEEDTPEMFETLLESLGVGYIVYDESHEWFRINYWSFMLLNPARIIDLSATIIPGDDAFIKDRYEERFPKETRYAKLEYDQYIDAVAIYYHCANKKMVDRVNRMRLYNHIEFENMIMKDKRMQAQYFKMLSDLSDMFFMKTYEKGQRLLYFFASREMCTRFTEYIGEYYPTMDVKRSIGGDNYEKFINADIGVSTPGKSGAAVDIPGLVLTIVTVNISKEDKNLQILGRTRTVDKWELDPKAIFLHCQEFGKHITYLNKRKTMFRGRVKSFKILNSKFTLK